GRLSPLQGRVGLRGVAAPPGGVDPGLPPERLPGRPPPRDDRRRRPRLPRRRRRAAGRADGDPRRHRLRRHLLARTLQPRLLAARPAGGRPRGAPGDEGGRGRGRGLTPPAATFDRRPTATGPPRIGRGVGAGGREKTAKRASMTRYGFGRASGFVGVPRMRWG